jgi:hypothetical protein
MKKQVRTLALVFGVLAPVILLASCSNDNFLPYLSSEDLDSLPPNSRGSNYYDLIIEVYEKGGKTEYETENEYEKRIELNKNNIYKKYGEYQVFQFSPLAVSRMIYIPEADLFAYVDKDDTSNGSIPLDVYEKNDISYMLSISLQGCADAISFVVDPQIAKSVKEYADHSVFVNGKLDLSKKGYNKNIINGKNNYETIPGLKNLEYISSKGNKSVSLSLDFVPKEFLIIQESTGKIVSRTKCDL